MSWRTKACILESIRGMNKNEIMYRILVLAVHVLAEPEFLHSHASFLCRLGLGNGADFDQVLI